MTDFIAIFSFNKLIVSGLKMTLSLAVLDLCFATLTGLLCAVVLTAKGNNVIIKPLQIIVRLYVELLRSSPLLLQLFFIYYGLGYLKINMPLFSSCLLALFLHHGAYICEIFRSGIESIPKEQYEAGKCLGLSSLDILLYIVLPQAFKVFLPPLIGYYISAVKDTPIVSLVGLADLVRNAKTIMGSTNMPLQTYFIVALIYFMICYPLSLYVKKLETRRA